MSDRKITVTSDRDPTDRSVRDPTLESAVMRDIVAELDAWLNGQRGFSINLVIKRARDEIMALRYALDESVKLQRHYALLLNQYDGGERMLFESAEAWIARLRALKDK